MKNIYGSLKTQSTKLKCDIRKKLGRLKRRYFGYFATDLALALDGPKLDCGCGPVKLSGHHGVDKVCLENVDYVVDLENEPLPLPNEMFNSCYTGSTFEHIKNIDNFVNEVSRVLKGGGDFFIHVPYAKSIGAFQDPTHVRFFTLLTMDYFAQNSTMVPQWYGVKAFTRVERRSFIMPTNLWGFILAPFINININTQIFYERNLSIFPAEAIEYHLIK